MINSDLTRNAIQQLPVVEKPEFEDDFFGHVTDPAEPRVEKADVGSPPAKKQKTEESEDQYKYYDELPDPDPDSDNSDIEDNDGEKPRLGNKSQISFQLIKMWTIRFAELELQERAKTRIGLFDTLEIMSIRAVVPYERYSEDIRLKNDLIHVMIAPRTIIINISVPTTLTCTSLQFWSHEEGCLFRWSDKVRLIKGIKYQHLAAKQFFALVQNYRNKFKTLQFSTKEFDSKRDPATWPFRSFYRKIQKLLQRSKRKIIVRSFEMTFHQYLGNPLSGEKNLKSILPYLNPEEINEIKLRVWNDDEVLRMRGLENFEKWFVIPKHLDTMKPVFKSAVDIDIQDKNIMVSDFNILWPHDTVHLLLNNDEFMLLVESCPVGSFVEGICMEFRPGEHFDIDTAENDLMNSNLATVHDNELTLGDGLVRVLFSKENEPKCIRFIGS